MASKPKDYTVFIWIILTNTEAIENKVEFFNYTYMVKGFQCHSSNNSLQLLELKGKKQQQNNTCYLNIFFVIFYSLIVRLPIQKRMGKKSLFNWNRTGKVK